MKNLLIFSVVILIISCTKFEGPEAIYGPEKDPEIIASTLSMKMKKGIFRGHLAGDETQATGQVYFKFEADNSAVYFKLIVAGIEGVQAAHLHHAHAGDELPGHPVLELFSGHIPEKSNGILAEGILTADDINCTCDHHEGHHNLAHLRKHIQDGETSVLVHSTNFPEGEIRGPIH